MAAVLLFYLYCLWIVQGNAIPCLLPVCCGVVLCAQGLSDAVQHRLQGWEFSVPCYVRLSLPWDMSASDLRVGTEAALRQLSGVLPAGSRIAITNQTALPLSTLYALACAAITAAGPSLTHVTVLPPSADTTDDGALATVIQHQPPLQHTAVGYLELSGAHANVPWPWHTLHITTYEMDMSQYLHLPDPTGGQHDVYIQGFDIDLSQVRPLFAHIHETN